MTARDDFRMARLNLIGTLLRYFGVTAPQPSPDLDRAVELDRAWSEYDSEIQRKHAATLDGIADRLTSGHMEPIDVLAARYNWTRAQALAQIVDDWAQTFDWGQHRNEPPELFKSEYA